MKSQDALILALLVVLIIIFVYQGSDMMSRRKKCKCPRREGFCGAGRRLHLTAADVRREQGAPPYTKLQNRIDSVIGSPDAQQLLQNPQRMKAYYRSSAMAKPEDIMSAERAMWAAATEQDRIAPYNTEKMSEPMEDTMQHFETAPAIDYGSMITDLVVDPRTRDNHRQWVNEMKGWAGTSTIKIDDLQDEDYLPFTGLRRPQAGVGQYNPMQITQVDDGMLARNAKFNFKG
jgi:hypothetical protein